MSVSSIGDGGIGPQCAETTTQKKCAETTTRKKTEKNRFDWKSQGQIPRSNRKIKKCAETTTRKKPEKNRF